MVQSLVIFGLNFFLSTCFLYVTNFYHKVNVLCYRQMTRAIEKQLSSNVTKTAGHIFDTGNSSALPKEDEATTSFFFISDYMYGGCLTFTVHLLHTLNKKQVFRITKRF